MFCLIKNSTIFYYFKFSTLEILDYRIHEFKIINSLSEPNYFRIERVRVEKTKEKIFAHMHKIKICIKGGFTCMLDIVFLI
jgi:hypothetical protein